MTLSTATRTQLRAICPVCFAQQAVTAAGRLAQHGYRRPQGWGQNVNDCGGSGRMHFGTEAGRAVTVEQASAIRRYAEAERERAPKVASGELPITDRRGNVITSCAPWKLAQYADGIVRNAKHADEHAVELDARVAAWVAVAPIAVTVEKKGPALLHFRDPRWGRLCAGSVMAGMKGACVTSQDDVTCPKCLARLAARALRAFSAAAPQA